MDPYLMAEVVNLDDTVKIATALGLLGSAGVLGTILNKRLPQRVGPIELLEQIQEERNEDRARLTQVEHTQRLTLDYVHELRQHIADGKPPPPPKWPDGLKV